MDRIKDNSVKLLRGVGLYGVLSLLVLLLIPMVAQAAPGELDLSFGTNGIVSGSTGGTDTFGGETGMAVQPDGKIVIVNTFLSDSDSQSEFLIERYDSDGTLDSSFGSGGVVKTSFGGTEATATSVIIEPDEKILVGGAAEGKLALARYDSDGTLDTSFGSLGLSTVAVSIPEASGFRSETGSLALLPSGKIVLGGTTFIRETSPSGPFSETHMMVARFNENGTLDTSFGTGGMAAGPVGNLYGLTTDQSGRILVAGWSTYDFAVARFTAAGNLDSSFGNAGLDKWELNRSGSKAADVIVLPTGKILVSGYGLGMAIFRLNEDGSPDHTFGGGDGVVTPTFSYPCCTASSAVAMAIDQMGRIVVVGNRNVEDENDPFLDEWAIGRLFYDGVPDPTFGNQGLVLNTFEGAATSDYATSVAVQSDGNILAAGTEGYPHGDLGLMRFNGEGNAPEEAPHLLSIANADPEQGAVSGRNLVCGYNCETDYEPWETVELETEGAYVQEGTGFREEPFAGWTTISGDPGTCTGTTSPCQVTMNANVKLEARFGADGGGTPGGGEPGGDQPGGSEPGGSQPGGGQSDGGSSQPVTAENQPVNAAATSVSTPAQSTSAHAKAITACIGKAKSIYKKKVKDAKHKSAKAKANAIKAAAKQKVKAVSACQG